MPTHEQIKRMKKGFGRQLKKERTTVERFLFPASSRRIRCVDERQDLDDSNGVEIPGGVYAIVDAVKKFKRVREERAWEIVQQAGIPIEGHVDDHHGDRGCGYAKLVEDEPETVLALERVRATERAGRIRQMGGALLTVHGDHQPTHAVINHRRGLSIDPDQAMPKGLGIFNFDQWAAEEYGKQLGINPKEFALHLRKVYKKTVTRLTGITKFIELK